MKHIIKRVSIALFFCVVILGIFAFNYEKLKEGYDQKLAARRAGVIFPLGYECDVVEEVLSISDAKQKLTGGLPPFEIRKIERNKKVKDFLDIVAISHKELMFESLYNKKFGFYSAGKVQLGKQQISFLTHPEYLSPNYGAMIAYHAYAMYRSMILAGDLLPEDNFEIFEMGAGYGTLAYDILTFIEKSAQEEKKYKYKTYWQVFYEKVKYIIGEISPELIKRQKEKNSKYIVQGKMEIKQLDAREVEKAFKDKKIKGLILSNELPDAFPVHKIVNKKGELLVEVAVATSTKKDLANVFAKEEQVGRHSMLSFLFMSEFKEELPKEITSELILLPKKIYISLKEKAAQERRSIDTYIKFYKAYIPVVYFPEIHGYLKRHGDYIDNLALEGSEYYINDGIAPFITSVSHILDKGFVLTIDYGSSAVHLHYFYIPMVHEIEKIRFYPLTVFGSGGNIYEAPGKRDITTDVNFTELAAVGRDVGLETVFYGKEKSLFDSMLLVSKKPSIEMQAFDIDTDVLATDDIPEKPSKILKKTSNEMGFKMLIQKKRYTQSSFTIEADQLPVFYQEFINIFDRLLEAVQSNDQKLVDTIEKKEEDNLYSFLLYLLHAGTCRKDINLLQYISIAGRSEYIRNILLRHAIRSKKNLRFLKYIWKFVPEETKKILLKSQEVKEIIRKKK